MNMRLIVLLALCIGVSQMCAMEKQTGKEHGNGSAFLSLDQVLGSFGTKAWEQERMKQIAEQEQQKQDREAALAQARNMSPKFQPITLNQTIGSLNGSSNQEELSEKEKEALKKAANLYFLQYKLGCGTYVPVLTHD